MVIDFGKFFPTDPIPLIIVDETKATIVALRQNRTKNNGKLQMSSFT